MVGIFKTNIGTDQEKLKVISAIHNQFDVNSCSIDIEDCDKVLRIVAQHTPITPDAIIFLLQSMGYQCDILE